MLYFDVQPMVEETNQASAPEEVSPPPDLIETLADGTKVKRRQLRMRACNEKNDKGKLCAGHLKRWFFYPPEISQQFGEEIYRCERCKTLYLPNPDEEPRTGTLCY